MNSKSKSVKRSVKEPVGCSTGPISEPKTVPFHKAKIENYKATLSNGKIANFPDGRRIEVWAVNERPGVAVRIFCPTLDGKTSKLLFGLTNDAAESLSILLQLQLNNVQLSGNSGEVK